MRVHGFTLLEILTVLFISGLMIALIGPRFGAQIETYRQRYALREIEDGLLQLPHRVRLSGRAVELPRDLGETDLGDGQPLLDLPAGWQLTVTPPLRISPLGICSEARVVVLPPVADGTGQPPSIVYDVEEFTCDLKPDKNHGG
jgi:prepilin-type N-terminal cleavage/methylation domain-containing protein